jgi:integrase
MKVKMNARSVAKLRAKPGRRAEYVDADLPGLVLRITENGARTWVVRYRHRGRTLRLTLGRADVLGLADARDRARDALASVQDGNDPAAIRRAAKHAKTIADLASTYIERHAKPKKRSWKQDERLLRRVILPEWRHRAVTDLTRRDVREFVQAIAERAPIQANRTLALLSKLFNFALDEELIQVSPVVRIPKPGKERRRERVLTEDEIRRFWRATDALDAPMQAFWRLRLITAQRGGEVVNMRWSDVDLDARWWTIPPEFSKNNLAHRVPLNELALTLLTKLRERRDAILVAREVRGDSRPAPIVFVLDDARGTRQQREAAATFNLDDFTGHDLRRTAASMMTGGGIPRLTVAKLLNHVESGVTAVYDRHSYDPEKRQAIDWWDKRLKDMVATTVQATIPQRAPRAATRAGPASRPTT